MSASGIYVLSRKTLKLIVGGEDLGKCNVGEILVHFLVIRPRAIEREGFESVRLEFVILKHLRSPSLFLCLASLSGFLFPLPLFVPFGLDLSLLFILELLPLFLLFSLLPLLLPPLPLLFILYSRVIVFSLRGASSLLALTVECSFKPLLLDLICACS